VTTLRLANGADDAVLRRFMRTHGMAGWVEMAIEREPSFFAGRDISGEEWAVIAEEQRDVVGMYSAAVRPLYVNGKAERLGYLGGLRIAPNYRHRIRYLRQAMHRSERSRPGPRRCHGGSPWWRPTTLRRENSWSGCAGAPDLPASGGVRDLRRSCFERSAPRIVAAGA